MELRTSPLAPRYIVPCGAAIMLTFQRTGFLSFSGKYLGIDVIINYLLVGVAAPLAMIAMVCDLRASQYLRFTGLVLFAAWVLVRGVVYADGLHSPSTSHMLSCVSAIILCSHIMPWELARLRRILVALSVLFSALVLTYEASILAEIVTGSYVYRLGFDVSPGVAVAFPRTVYTLAVASVASVIAEQRGTMRLLCAASAVIPLILGFATAGRGGLVGLIAAIVVMIIGLPIVRAGRRRWVVLLGPAILLALLYIGYRTVLSLFPVMVERFAFQDDAGRFAIWANALAEVSLFGRGPGETYAHNVFLEALQDYGIVGLVLFVLVLATCLVELRRAWVLRRDIETLWVTAIVALHLVCQQLSLNMYWGFFWGALVLPIGLNGWSTNTALGDRSADVISYRDESH